MFILNFYLFLNWIESAGFETNSMTVLFQSSDLIEFLAFCHCLFFVIWILSIGSKLLPRISYHFIASINRNTGNFTVMRPPNHRTILFYKFLISFAFVQLVVKVPYIVNRICKRNTHFCSAGSLSEILLFFNPLVICDIIEFPCCSVVT